MDIPNNLKYTKEHEWIKVEDKTAYVGITDYAQSELGDIVFVGSDVQLVAPVKVGDGSTIAAGSTITKDVDSNNLAISRTEQKLVPSWERPKKK